MNLKNRSRGFTVTTLLKASAKNAELSNILASTRVFRVNFKKVLPAISLQNTSCERL